MVLLCCERLFVPAFVKTDIDRNIADQFIFGKENIFRIGDMRKNRLVLFEFYRDPAKNFGYEEMLSELEAIVADAETRLAEDEATA